MEAQLRHNLTRLAERYAAAEDCKLSRVARLATGDSDFFDRIQRASFTARTYDRTVKWFERNWPEDTPWPSDVPRIISKKSATLSEVG